MNILGELKSQLYSVKDDIRGFARKSVIPIAVAGSIALTSCVQPVQPIPQPPKPPVEQPAPAPVQPPAQQHKSPPALGPEEEYNSFVSTLQDKTFSKYALDTRIGMELPKDLRNKFLQNPEAYKDEAFVFILGEIEKLYPELVKEQRNLFEYYKKNFNRTIRVNDIEVLEDWYEIVKNNKDMAVFGTSIKSMLEEGLPGKRKIWTPGEAANWIFNDVEPLYLEKEQPWKDYFPLPLWKYLVCRDSNLKRFVAYSWNESTISNSSPGRPFKDITVKNVYESAEWRDFKKVTDRLNSPDLISIYLRTSNIEGKTFFPHSYPSQTFDRRSGDCDDMSHLALHCLIKNGYEYFDGVTYKDNAACVLVILWDISGRVNVVAGHAICLYTKDNSFYYINSQAGNKGPHKSVEECVNITVPAWKAYAFHNNDWIMTKIIYK